MKPHIEKRACRRNNCIASIICTYFNSDRYHLAKTANYSKGGLQIDANFPLKPGANVYIRVEDLLPNASGSMASGFCEMRSLSIAQVRWCKEILDPHGSSYKVGLKYYNPAV